MDHVFSWFSDAGAWPEHPGSGCAVVDEAVVGPSALLDHVETMLGLGGPEIATVERIAVYRRKIEAAGAGRFWSSSFELDSWSSTRELHRPMPTRCADPAKVKTHLEPGVEKSLT
jgi:ATP-dependent helicase/nuclease subunit B